MTNSSRVRVYMAVSFDGFIAGPDDDISWLEQSYAHEGDLPAQPGALQFDDFMAEVGAMLMGRNTYEAVERIGQWPYGDVPVLVATTRSLEAMSNTVAAASGEIADLIARAKQLANGRDVYLDGGALVRQALDARLVDEIVATFIPVLLGSGVRLFDGLVSRSSLQFVRHDSMDNGMLQVCARVVRSR